MIVVADTSPLYYLVRIDAVDALPKLYGRILVPPRVQEELLNAGPPIGGWVNTAPLWLEVRQPSLSPFFQGIDAGEASAIALAIELDADRLLIDDRAGRRVTVAQGLEIAGTLAIILDAALADLLDLNNSLDRLAKTNFFATESLLASIREEYTHRKQDP